MKSTTPIQLRRKRFLEKYGPKVPTRTWSGPRGIFALLSVFLLTFGMYLLLHEQHFELPIFLGGALLLAAVMFVPDNLLEKIRTCLTGTGSL